MSVLDYVLGGILLVAAVFLVIAVLMQEGKSKGLGSVGGSSSSDTFFGKTKGRTWERTLAKLTTIVGIFFVVIVLLVYILQDDLDTDKHFDDNASILDQAETTVKETEKEKTPEVTTDADTKTEGEQNETPEASDTADTTGASADSESPEA